MLKPSLLIFAVFGTLSAQQVVAPTPEQVGSPRGETWGDYNLLQSYELGYRFRLVGGDIGEYRSDANYGNGLRLLGSSFALESKDGHGHYFDELLLNTSGLGNDPYQYTMLRVQKNRLYRYDMSWRSDDYFNPGLTVAGGLHLANTQRRLQDHDLTLLPQSRIRFHLGYSRNAEDGPALSTAQEFNNNGSAYPVFSNVKRLWNEYRVGADAEFAGFIFTVQHRWDYFGDQTPAVSQGVVAAGTPNDQSVLQQFQHALPLHGSSPGWLGNLHTKRKWWGMNARATYVAGKNDFALDETAQGLGASGLGVTRQIVVGGNASRPEVGGDLEISAFPTDRLTFVNNTSISDSRLDGQTSYTEFLNGATPGATAYFRYLGIRLITNSADVNYRIADWIGVYGGYRYADRQVRTIEGQDFANSVYEVGNQMQAGVAGVRIHPVAPLTFNLEGELGRTNQPLALLSDKNFSTLNARAQYRMKKLQMSAAYKESYNFNSFFSFYAEHDRGYSASAVWTPKDWFSVDASYNKLHNQSNGFLAFYQGPIGGSLNIDFTDRSLYISNIHSANLSLRFAVGRRADVFVGYNITKDTGDGRGSAVPATATTPIQALLGSVQTFPLTYQSPLARVSIVLTPKLRWNAGYQYYDYFETFGLLGYYQNFHAHTGFTSVQWTF